VDDWSSESNVGSGRTGVLMAAVNGGCLAEEIALADSVAIGLGSGLVLVDKAWWPARWQARAGPGPAPAVTMASWAASQWAKAHFHFSFYFLNA
jgi:hypothetical protein